MEQGQQFWMWTKRKQYSMRSSPTKPSCNSYDESSWEEQAFAEDASGPLGGCIWPPRSYTCSFCRREFRSAQALGGHMNVHRRDRARMKQPSSPQNHHHQIQTPPPNSSSLMGFLYPNYNNNNSNYSASSTNPNSVLVAASASSPSNHHNKKAYDDDHSTSVIPFLPPQQAAHINNNNSSSLYYSSSKSNWSNLANNDEAHHEKISKVLDCGCVNNGKADVAFSLNLVVCRAHTSPLEFDTKEEEDQEEEEEEEEEEEDAIIGCKKRRLNINTSKEASSILPFFPTSNSSVQLSPNSMEELDLELRLGHKV